MKTFRDNLKELADRPENDGYYRHTFGYTGRSQTQGLVERFNGTLKRMLQSERNFLMDGGVPADTIKTRDLLKGSV